MVGLLFWLRVAITRPIRLLQALWLTLRLSVGVQSKVFLLHLHTTEACVLLRWFSDSGVDHVHAHFGTIQPPWRCCVAGGEYSFTVHGPEEFDKVKALALVEKSRAGCFCSDS